MYKCTNQPNSVARLFGHGAELSNNPYLYAKRGKSYGHHGGV